MPARTVVFTAVKKFDGQEMRVLAPGEYTQMSGRAGRRGKDDRGICIIMVDEKMEKESLQGMCMGQPQPLNSEFKLSYYSILNLLKRASGTVNAEYVIARSFHQFQHTRAVPAKQAGAAVCTLASPSLRPRSCSPNDHPTPSLMSDLGWWFGSAVAAHLNPQAADVAVRWLAPEQVLYFISSLSPLPMPGRVKPRVKHA